MLESLHDLFKKLITEYADKYAEVKATKDRKHPFRDLISSSIPFNLMALPKVDTQIYSIDGSYGIGSWTEVPYILVRNKYVSSSASSGVYIVYLLNKDEKVLYLAFEQSANGIKETLDDQIDKTHFSQSRKGNAKVNEKLKEKCAELRKQIGTTEFFADDNINTGKASYDYGAIYYAKYTLEDLPDNEQLTHDLYRFMELYEKYYTDIFLPVHPECPALRFPVHVNPLPRKGEILPFTLSTLHPSFQSSFSLRFLTSLLAKPFVILTGNSGTGKTRIAKEFAEYLEVIDENRKKNWELVAVGADWTDNTEVMGFFDPLGGESGKGVYRKSRILELLERANSHPDVPYFLILDEC